MSLICCPIHVTVPDEVDDSLARAASALAKGAKLVEWRVDALAEEDAPVALAAIRRLVRDCPVPCIVTIRPSWEGGTYGGSETDRISLLEAIGTGDDTPKYIDVELDAYRTSRNRRQKVNLAVDHESQVRDVGPKLILSTHDFTGRPGDLLQRVAAMAAEPACSVMKVAWMARSLRDNLEAFDLLAERAKPAVVLCMGEYGLPSRVLAPKFGGLFTFAALASGAESAPGQPSLEELRDLYRFGRIGRGTRTYGVIGWPVGHSRSPRFHNDRFAGLGFDGVYLPLPVRPEWEQFKATVGDFVDHRRLDFRGASVTLPHKEHCLRFVAERGGRVGALAKALGAANTLVVEEDGTLACGNTDAPAAVACLAQALGRSDGRLDGARVAVLGAGGVARAVAGGVALAGGQAILVNRSADRAQQVAGELAAGLAALDRRGLDGCESLAADGPPGRVEAGRGTLLGCGCFDAYVNATPVGMAGGPDPEGNPLDSLLEAAGGCFGPELVRGAVVFDTVYAPEETPLLRETRLVARAAVGGLAMFEAQAERQAIRWCGR